MHAAAGIYNRNLDDVISAEQHYKLALELGFAQSNLDLASMLLNQDFPSVSQIQEAIECIDRAITQIPTDAPVKFAVRHSFKFPEKFPLEILVPMLSRHADHGDSDCAMALLELVNFEKIPDKFINSQHVKAALELAPFGIGTLPLLLDLHETYSNNPDFNLGKIIDTAHQLLESVVIENRAGADACEVLGRMALHGIGYGQPQIDQAIKYFARGDDEYNSGICARYLSIALLKFGQYTAGFQKAYELMKEGDHDSMALVGYCLIEGRGCEGDPHAGNLFLNRAQSAGSTIASPFE